MILGKNAICDIVVEYCNDDTEKQTLQYMVSLSGVLTRLIDIC